MQIATFLACMCVLLFGNLVLTALVSETTDMLSEVKARGCAHFTHEYACRMVRGLSEKMDERFGDADALVTTLFGAHAAARICVRWLVRHALRDALPAAMQLCSRIYAHARQLLADKTG